MVRPLILGYLLVLLLLTILAGGDPFHPPLRDLLELEERVGFLSPLPLPPFSFSDSSSQTSVDLFLEEEAVSSFVPLSSLSAPSPTPTRSSPSPAQSALRRSPCSQAVHPLSSLFLFIPFHSRPPPSSPVQKPVPSGHSS